MDRNEAKLLLEILRNAYPNTYRNMAATEATKIVDFYLDMFGECESVVVAQALKNYIKVNQYPPTPAGIFEQIELITQTTTDADLWNAILKASKNSYYGAEEEFKKLPLECQRWCGSPDNLRELGQCDVSTFSTVVKGQFLKTIGQVRQSEKVQNSLPAEVKAALLQSKLMLEGKDDEED